MIGRDDVLRDLKTRLTQARDHTQILTAIKGWPGVGKTTVAAALAYDDDLKRAFPQGVLWTSLGPSPNVLSELTAWGRALGVDLSRVESVPQASAELAARLRDARKLLIVDDVWQAEHAQPFKVGGPGCAALVTTRHADVARALAPDARSICNLPELTEAQSLDLLSKLAPAVMAKCEPACRELARALDGLPLALQVAGRLLQAEADAGFGVDELLAELREGKRILDETAPADRADVAKQTTPTIAALFRTSTDWLDDETRAAFARLCAFPPKPATFDLAAFEAVCVETPHVETPRRGVSTIRTLVDRGLMEAASEGRWQLHALMALHARSLLDDAQHAAARLRHAQHYERVLRSADELYLQGGESILRGLALFAEWINIQVGQRWAAEHIDTDNMVAQLCRDYPMASRYCLRLRQHPRDQIRWSETALSASQRLKDRSAEGIRHGILGLALADLGEVRQSVEHYDLALAIARETKDRKNEGVWLGNLGLAYANLGEARHAIEFYEQRLVIAREIGDRRGEGNALGNLGIAYAALGEPRRAIQYHEQALVIDREIGDRRGEGADLGNLGIAYAALGEGTDLDNLGLAYAALGETRRAIEFYEQALVIDREIGDRRGEALASWNLGLAYEKQGELARAVKLMQICVDFERELGHPDADKDAAQVEDLRAKIAAADKSG